MVGMVVTISPSLSLYRMVVFPAASRPTIRIRISLRPHSLSNNLEKVIPMVAEPRTESARGDRGNKGGTVGGGRKKGVGRDDRPYRREWRVRCDRGRGEEGEGEKGKRKEEKKKKNTRKIK